MLRSIVTVAAAALVAGALLPAATAPVRAADDTEARRAAVASAASVVAAARKEEAGDADTMTAIREARDALAPWANDMRRAFWDGPASEQSRAFGTVWNELLTVAAYHGKRFKARFILEKTPIIWKRYLVGLPVGGRWRIAYNRDKKTYDQLHMFIRQYRPGGKLLREIKVWNYRWDTTYSGIGGENYKKLAKVMHEVDKDCVAKKGRKASRGVTAQRLNAEFKRVYTYFVEGLDVDAEQHLRRQSYYIKGNWSYTHCLEVITYLDPLDDDDGVTIWQTEDDGGEIKAVLSSFVTNPDYVPPK